MSVEATQGVLMDVEDERGRQDQKWGVQYHHPAWWVVILGEEFGEVCRAVYETEPGTAGSQDYRDELVQVAAVAVAAIEAYDRNPINNPRVARRQA